VRLSAHAGGTSDKVWLTIGFAVWACGLVFGLFAVRRHPDAVAGLSTRRSLH